jgi:hypothetical protein
MKDEGKHKESLRKDKKRRKIFITLASVVNVERERER